MRDLNVTIVQAPIVWMDESANLDAFSRLIEGIGEPTDLIILPEMFTTGFAMDPASCASRMDGRPVAWMRDIAASCNAAVAGSLAIAEGGRFYNRFIMADPEGRIHTYDKRHLFRMGGEHTVYTSGAERVTLPFREWRIRPFVCYDLRFPVWMRNRGDEYDLAVIVANWPDRRAHHWRALAVARAIENQAFVAAVNRVGADGNGVAHLGGSLVVDPWGQVLFEAGSATCVRTLTLSAEVVRSCRERFPVWKDADRDLFR